MTDPQLEQLGLILLRSMLVAFEMGRLPELTPACLEQAFSGAMEEVIKVIDS